MSNPLLQDLQARGLIAQQTAGDILGEHLDSPRILYCGFDPTADSLHIGSLVPLLMLRRFQLAGHRPIAVVGGSTGLIGDPSFKAAERQLNDGELVQFWCARLAAQIAKFLDFDGDNPALMANNYDWTGDMSVLEFMRHVGKHFSVNAMIQKESVKQRLDRDDSGISFTEFSYMLLQSWDFAELYRRHDCTLQIGGSDQWGNITGGIDLTRRLHGGKVFGLTMPLITKADGTKFGKTEAGTIWLDAKKTSPYAFFQFWLNTADADVYRFLKYFTFLSVEEINEIQRADEVSGGRPQAQRILACEVTKLVHGDAGLSAAQRITDALFSGEVNQLGLGDLEQLEQDGIPFAHLEQLPADPADASAAPTTWWDLPLTTLFVRTGLARNGSQIKDALQREAIFINGRPVGLGENLDAARLFDAESALFGSYFVVRFGKKQYQLLRR